MSWSLRVPSALAQGLEHSRLLKLSQQVQEPWQSLIAASYGITDTSPDRHLTRLLPR